MKLVGQDKIINLINELNLDTFPRSLLLLGQEGSGRHSLCSIISERLKLPIEDITEFLTLDKINEIYMKPEPFIYIIDTRKISVKEQNTILKFIEEPLKNAFILMLSDNKHRLLETIQNRCQVWQLETYTSDILEQFITQSSANKELILDIATTPGQVKKLQSVDISAHLDLAQKIVDCIKVASLPNTLTIADKINYKDEPDKLNFEIFLKLLAYATFNGCVNNKYDYCSDMYIMTKNLLNDATIANIDKKRLLENYLTRLWLRVNS